jgi:23S rRNA (guanosine2251-2'-O)-methyltransferase
VVDYTVPTALVFGAEGTGLRRLVRETCDRVVSVPMAGAVASLNVSVTAGIGLFEAVRQRRAGARAR